MENKITSKMVLEALEQVRAGFTVSRMALGAATILVPLANKGEKWGKRFNDVQAKYHKFLLDVHEELIAHLTRLQEEEAKEENNEVKED